MTSIVFPASAGFGLRPAQSAVGGQMSLDRVHKSIPSGYGFDIGYGDPVSYDGNGNIVKGDGTNTNGVCASADAVSVGVEYFDNFNGGQPALRRAWFANQATFMAQPAAIDVSGLTDKSQLFEAVTDAVVTAAAQGKNANLNVGAADPVTGFSGCTVNTASIGTGTAVKIVRIIQSVDSGYIKDTVPGLSFTRVLVKLLKA